MFAQTWMYVYILWYSIYVCKYLYIKRKFVLVDANGSYFLSVCTYVYVIGMACLIGISVKLKLNKNLIITAICVYVWK